MSLSLSPSLPLPPYPLPLSLQPINVSSVRIKREERKTALCRIPGEPASRSCRGLSEEHACTLVFYLYGSLGTIE